MLKSMRRRVVTALCAMCLVSALWVLPVNAAEAFDPVFYAALYPDLAAALGTDPQVLLNHYLNYGMKEGRLPYRGAEPGAAVDGIAEPSAAASEGAPVTGRYIDRVPAMLESLYQSYEMTRTKQRASVILPKEVTDIVEVHDEEQDDGEGGIYTQSWRVYIYGNDMYRLIVNHSARNISTWNGSFTMTYEDIFNDYGVSVPYMVYKFTQQDLRYVASYLDSPVVLRKEYEWPRDHILPGNTRYDTFARNEIFGYYKGIPIDITLYDSNVAYPENESPYHYMPDIEIIFMGGITMDKCINNRLADGYRRQ